MDSSHLFLASSMSQQSLGGCLRRKGSPKNRAGRMQPSSFLKLSDAVGKGLEYILQSAMGSPRAQTARATPHHFSGSQRLKEGSGTFLKVTEDLLEEGKYSP